MNINFEDIITKANKRKDDLVSLARLLEDSPEMLAHLEVALAWAITVETAYAALDKEGCGMLPKPVNETLSYFGSTVIGLKRAVRDGVTVFKHLVTEPKS